MKLKRSLATGAAIVIAGLSLVACGGDDEGGDGGGDASETSDTSDADDTEAADDTDAADDAGPAAGAPDDANADDFCAVFTDVTADLSGGGSADEQADAAHEVADTFIDVGTPEDMPDGARNGFEVFINFLDGVDAADIEAFEEANPADNQAYADALGIDEAEVADVTEFFTYAATACVGAIPTDGAS